MHEGAAVIARGGLGLGLRERVEEHLDLYALSCALQSPRCRPRGQLPQMRIYRRCRYGYVPPPQLHVSHH